MWRGGRETTMSTTSIIDKISFKKSFIKNCIYFTDNKFFQNRKLFSRNCVVILINQKYTCVFNVLPTTYMIINKTNYK